jgi:hypothetical protein
MITKKQARDSRTQYAEIHYTGKHECKRVIGPRGGETLTITRVRANGKCQTWKRDEKRFRLPIKYGMWEYYEINQDNAGDFHLASECPLNQEMKN